MKFFNLLIVMIFIFHTLHERFFSFIDHDEMLKRIVGRIITKLAQRHSAWASYRASYL